MTLDEKDKIRRKIDEPITEGAKKFIEEYLIPWFERNKKDYCCQTSIICIYETSEIPSKFNYAMVREAAKIAKDYGITAEKVSSVGQRGYSFRYNRQT